jgi:hypothetical protein
MSPAVAEVVPTHGSNIVWVAVTQTLSASGPPSDPRVWINLRKHLRRLHPTAVGPGHWIERSRLRFPQRGSTEAVPRRW